MQGIQYLVVAFFFGTGGALIAHVKGNPRWIWFLICALLPFVGILAALLSRADMKEPRVRCDRCGKVVAASDSVCMGCGNELYFPEQPLPSLQDELLSGRR